MALFREEGAEVFAESWDMTKPEMADEIVREVGRVDILIANLAYRTATRWPTRRLTRISNMPCRGSCIRCIG